jgi:hypothetical protein
MDTETWKRLLVILVENSRRILNAQFGVDRAESSFFSIVDLLREKEHLKSDFLTLVAETMEKRDEWGLDEDSVPRELIELVAHEFRWPELLELCEARVQKMYGGDRSRAVNDISWHVPLAFDENWPDRNFYRHYRS